MGIQELGSEEDRLVDHPDLTVQELIDMYGKEATRRGLEYIRSLSSADERFRDSGKEKKEKYADRVVEGQGVDPSQVSEEAKQEASTSWEKAMEDDGLGLRD